LQDLPCTLKEVHKKAHEFLGTEQNFLPSGCNQNIDQFGNQGPEPFARGDPSAQFTLLSAKKVSLLDEQSRWTLFVSM